MKVTLNRTKCNEKGLITHAEATVHYKHLGIVKRTRQAFASGNQTWYWLDDGTLIWEESVTNLLCGAVRAAEYKANTQPNLTSQSNAGTL